MQFTRLDLVLTAASLLAVYGLVSMWKGRRRHEGMTVPPEIQESDLFPKAQKPGVPSRTPGVVADDDDGIMRVAPRIAGGMTALRGRYPWIVRMFYKGKPWCTGFLVSPTQVMTAAHCVDDNTMAKDITMRIGGNKSDGSDGESRACKRFIMGPYENTKMRAHDWALLHLYTPSTKMPIKLDGWTVGPLNLKKGTEVYVAGFGEAWGNIKYKDLGIVEMRLNGVTPGTLQTANNLDGKWRSPCHGDSGGPVFIRGDARNGSQDIVIGIVSGPSGRTLVKGDCNPRDPPAIYARTSGVMTQIKSKKFIRGK